MTKRLLLVLAVICIVGVTVAAYYRSNSGDDGPQLLTAAVTRGDVVEAVQATGTLQAVTTVQVGTQVSGTIKALYADFNSQVRKGQVVAELEPSLFQTQVEQAQATLVRLQSETDRARVALEDAKLKLQRAVELKSRQLIPETDFETAQANAHLAEAALKSADAQVVQARASLNQSQVNLGHTVIKAPIDGIVISRDVDVGQTVAASMQAPTLFIIAQDLTRMQVSASIDESDIGRIAPGQSVTFRVDAYPADTFEGVVSQVRLQPVVEQNVVSYATVIDVPNRELKLKPGMTATVTVAVAEDADVLRVPSAALAFRPTPPVLAAFGREVQEPTADGRPAERRRVRGGAPGTRGTASAAGAPGAPSAADAADVADAAAATDRAGAPRGATAGRQGPARAAGGDRSREVRGPHVWVLADGQLRPVAVKTGVSDGTTVAILEGDIAEHAEVVTGVATQTASASASTGGSPLLPFGGRRGNRPAGGARPGGGR